MNLNTPTGMQGTIQYGTQYLPYSLVRLKAKV